MKMLNVEIDKIVMQKSNNDKWCGEIIKSLAAVKEWDGKTVFFNDAELKSYGANTGAKQWSANSKRWLQAYTDKLYSDTNIKFTSKRHTLLDGTKGLAIGISQGLSEWHKLNEPVNEPIDEPIDELINKPITEKRPKQKA